MSYTLGYQVDSDVCVGLGMFPEMLYDCHIKQIGHLDFPTPVDRRKNFGHKLFNSLYRSPS